MRFIIAIICFIGSLGMIFLIILPEQQNLRTIIVDADVVELDIENINRHERIVNEMAKRITTDYKEGIEKAKGGVPDDHYTPSFFSELRRASYRTGIRIETLGDFSNREHPHIEGIVETEISFQAEGSYRNFKNFIQELERFARVANITEIAIDGDATEDESGSPTYQLSLLIYSRYSK